MKKVIYIIITLIVSLILLKLYLTNNYNNVFINNYNNGIYKEDTLDFTYKLNVEEPYIVHYNKGNVLYKNNKYKEAVSEYKKALTLFPREDRVCDIRVNLVLSRIKLIDFDSVVDDISLEKVKKELRELIDILHEDDCANDSNTGKSHDAEQLEDDILKYLNSEPSNPDDPNPDDPKDNPNPEDPNEKEKNKKLEEIIKQAAKEKNKSGITDEYLGGYEYYYGKTW